MKLIYFIIVVMFSTFIAAQSNTLSFIESKQAFSKTNSYNIVKGDIDNDGDIDVLVSNKDDSCHLWLNNGKGKFIKSEQKLCSGYPIALGDLDGDTDLDLFVIQSDNNNMMLINDGKGVFSTSLQKIENSGCTDISLGDLDNDGDLDAFVVYWGHPTGKPNQVWLNNGSGQFSDTKQKLGCSISSAVDLGDLDNDGDLDAFVTNKRDSSHNPLPNKIYINDGKGFFTDSGQNIGNSASKNIALGDLDNDGDIDAFVANTSHARKSNPQNKVWLNDGLGNFSDSGQKIGDSYSVEVKLGDINFDGYLDVYVGNWLKPDKIWINNGNAIFSDSNIELKNTNSFGVSLADYDGDTDLDIFTVKNNEWHKVDNKNQVYFNQFINCNKKGEYLGQKLPGNIPEVFAPGIVSDTSWAEHCQVAISPNGDEIFWSAWTSKYRTEDGNYNTEQLFYTKLQNGVWSKPKIAEFTINNKHGLNGGPVFSPDGEKLFFYRVKSPWRTSIKRTLYVEKKDGKWSEPKDAGDEYNSGSNNYTPIFTKVGTAYKYQGKVLKYEYENDKFTFSDTVKINKEYRIGWNVYVSPKEEFMIFAAFHKNNYGDLDLYISYKNKNDNWGEPINLGNKINTDKRERFPIISPDGKYLFFMRHTETQDFFWVSTDVINDLKIK